MRTLSALETKLGVVDYVLACIASCLAAYSAGSGLNNSDVSNVFIVMTVAATAIAYVIQRFIPPKLALADGFLYAACGFFAFYYRAQLNGMLPGDGFPETLQLSGWLCWMLILGSAFMWRDSTVLFQAVPGIAIFGYVGTWDTFRSAPFLFFGFLLCFATLFARAHGREMMMRARESGYVATGSDSLTPRGFLASLRAGPWRWVAGPEWALLSALFVVAISVVGGPFLQFSLQGVAGAVKLPPPPTVAMRQKFFGPSGGAGAGFVEKSGDPIGNGPHADIIGKPIFTAFMTVPSYLKLHTFATYSPKGWIGLGVARASSVREQDELRFNTQPATEFRAEPFAVHYLSGSYDSVPVPGNVIEVTDIPNNRLRVDGTVPNDNFVFSSNTTVEGTVGIPMGSRTPVSVDRSPFLARFSDSSRLPVTQKVKALAEKSIIGAKTDFDKAMALRAAISGRCIYDLQAPAVPPGIDPVEYFLFTSKRGYCDLFASAMTVMARSVNLPARYVVGFAPFTDPTPKQGAYTIYDTDYHAWCEIYFKGVGWTIFDSTDDAAMAPGAGRGAHLESIPWYKQATFKLSFATIAIVFVGWMSYFAFRKVQARLNLFRTSLPALQKGYADLVKVVESKTGKPRRPSQTPHEYLVAVKPYLDGSYAAFSEATEAFVSTFYSTADPSPESIDHFQGLVKNAKDALKPIKPPKDPPPEHES